MKDYAINTLLPAGRSHQQSGTATNKLDFSFNGLQVTVNVRLVRQ